MKDQTNEAQNGVFIPAAGAWARAADFDNTPDNEVVTGTTVSVLGGTVNARSTYTVTIFLGTIDVDPMWFTTMTLVNVGDGLTMSGNTVSLATALTTVTDITTTELTITGNVLVNHAAADSVITLQQGGASVSLTCPSTGVATIAASGGYVAIPGLRIATPTGLYADASSWTSGSGLLTTPAPLAMVWTERVDLGSNWTVNYTSNGYIRYIGGASTYVTITLVLSIGTAGGASTITVAPQVDDGALSFSNIAGAAMDTYMASTSAVASFVVTCALSLAVGRTIRFNSASTSNGVTYTLNHSMLTIAQLT